MADEDPINIALHPVLLGPFKTWLAARGCHLSPPIPADDEGTEFFHVVVPNVMPVPRIKDHPFQDVPESGGFCIYTKPDGMSNMCGARRADHARLD